MAGHKRRRKIKPAVHPPERFPQTPRFSRAGRALRKPNEGQDSSFVNSTTALTFVVSDEESELSSQEESIVVKARRRLSPTPDLGEPYILPDGNDQLDSESLPSETDTSQRHAKPKSIDKAANPMQIVLNIPKGPARQVVLNIQGANSAPSAGTNRSSKVKAVTKPQKISKNVIENAGLVGRLPMELRNQIYLALFKAGDVIDLGHPNRDMRRSAAFLRTCRLVYEEGRVILYSRNSFALTRRQDNKSLLWSQDRLEMGFLPCRVFIKSIGPHNVALLRHIKLKLMDGSAYYGRNQDVDERRAVNDEYLLSALRDLTRYGQLQRLDLDLMTRKHVDLYDYRFVNTLTRIKVDEFDCRELHNPHTVIPRRKATVAASQKDFVLHCERKMIRSPALHPPAAVQ